MLITFAVCVPTASFAQITVTYTGTQLAGDKQVPASAQFSVEPGRAAMIMKGAHGGRMLYDEKAGVLHIISDDDRTFFDITKAGVESGDPMGMNAEMQKQLEKVPKEQRAAAEQMMKSMMSSGPSQPQLTYVWTKDTKTVSSYECTLVEGMRGNDKVTEYCGTKSPDFTLSPAEHATMLSMQGYLRNFGITSRAGDETRAFQWDTSVDGYPVITRCFRDGKMTLELVYQSLSRTPLPNDLFELPGSYTKMDFSKGRR
jgi:hypothetical protein